MNRKENIQQLKTETFDVCVIGGGASGAGAALDAATRGLKVALIERKDFASETSSRSTKLIHGGVRYLEQAFKNLDFGQLRQVKHGLEERKFVLRNAPHLAHPLALITPVFSAFEAAYFSAGLLLYGFFAKNDSLPKAKWLNKKKTFEKIPTLSKTVHSSVMYYDGQLDDARYCLALAHSADEAGAATLNHAALAGFTKDENGKILSATVKSQLPEEHGMEIEVKAKIFVNCTGPFSDAVRIMANSEEEARIVPSKGVHILIPKEFLPGKEAMLIPKTKDGRVVFVIPFENKVMVGTTDTPYHDLEKEPILESSEVDYLLETMAPFFNKLPARKDILSGFGGLRPLISEKGSNPNDTKSLLRDHAVEVDEKSGLISLLGGKWTTYRLMGQDVIDAVCKELNVATESQTKEHYLVGGENYRPENYQNLMNTYALPEDVAKHVSEKYGDMAEKVLALTHFDENLTQRLHPDYPFIGAEVVYTVRDEMAVSLRDFFARRTRFELLSWKAAKQSIPKVADLMGEELGWTPEQKSANITAYSNEISHFQNQAGVA
jgi:glycerol-3-phosphate dehydrogenase